MRGRWLVSPDDRRAEEAAKRAANAAAHRCRPPRVRPWWPNGVVWSCDGCGGKFVLRNVWIYDSQKRRWMPVTSAEWADHLMSGATR